jgi:hypothetical protein
MVGLVTPESSVDLALHILRTDVGVHGTVVGPGHAPRSFAGWLELTAAIAAALAASDEPLAPQAS